MSEWEQEYLANLRRHAREVRTLLSNANKPERERMIVRAFLRCLGVSFSDDDVQAGTYEPVDVRFRTARFQIMEIVGDKKRGDEWRQRQDRCNSAASLSDVADPWVSSQSMSLAEVSQLIVEALAKKVAHYGVNGCSGIDALVYVDLQGRHLFPPDAILDPEVVTELTQQGWRSVSMLSVPYAAVLFAASGAPDFLSEKVALVSNAWAEPDGWFDPD